MPETTIRETSPVPTGPRRRPARQSILIGWVFRGDRCWWKRWASGQETLISTGGRALTGGAGRRHDEHMSQRDEPLLTARVHVDLVRHASALC
ncbi:putative leader peptide [Micromonospora rubida]|uniref:Leader peptide n=1 Tax=Micromonospora rubida TaxID=2697657 RepID=A0ABW7SK36_9ACTN